MFGLNGQKFLRRFKNFARPCKVGGSIDTERNRVNEADMDAHARLERPELFELLPHLQGRRRKADEALQRLPSIGVEPDMMVERSFAERGVARVK